MKESVYQAPILALLYLEQDIAQCVCYIAATDNGLLAGD